MKWIQITKEKWILPTLLALIVMFAVLGVQQMPFSHPDPIAEAVYAYAKIVKPAAVAFLLYLAGMIWLSFKRRRKPERMFLFLFIPLSTVMMFLMPVSRVPDEPAHLNKSFVMSTGQIFLTEEIRTKGYQIPENLLSGINDPFLFTLKEQKEMVGSTFSDTMISLMPNTATEIYPHLCYAPQAAGLAIGRMFTNDRLTVLYTGRMASLLFATVLLYFAIKKIPKGKYLLLGISLLPMTLQECASLSADGGTISIMALFVALVLKYRESPIKLSGIQLTGIYLLVIAVAFFKVLYFPLLFLVYLLPHSCFRTNARAKIHKNAMVVLALGLLVGWFAYCYFNYFKGATGGVESYMKPQLERLAQKPSMFFIYLFRTIKKHIGFYTYPLFGHGLSWFNIIPPGFMWKFGFLSLMMVYLSQEGFSYSKEDKRLRIGLLGASLAVIAVIFMGLFIWWTSPSDDAILGVQARYFIPLLYPAMMSVRWQKTFKNAETIHLPASLFAMTACSICVLCYVFLCTYA